MTAPRAPLLAALGARRFALALALAFAAAGCPSSSSSVAGDGGLGDDGGFVALDGSGICASFTHSGDPCAPASGTICFRQCKTDGCQCKAGTDGAGRWVCVTDFSCEPDGSPLDDGAASDGAASDGADADADAGADAATDADAAG